MVARPYPPMAINANESGHSRSPQRSRMISSNFSLMMTSTATPVGFAKNLVFRSSTNPLISVRVVVLMERHLSMWLWAMKARRWGGDEGAAPSSPGYPAQSVCHRDRGHGRKLDRRTEPQSNANLRIGAPRTGDVPPSRENR